MTRRLRHRTRRATEQCAGCRYWFTPKGLPQHLDYTSRAACMALRQARIGSDPPNSTLPPKSSPSCPSKSPQPAQFDGDFFGHYRPEDWDHYDEFQDRQDGDAMDVDEAEGDGDAMDVDEADAADGGEDLDESVYDEEEDADRFEEEGGWEPAPCHEQEDGRPFGAEDDPGETDGAFHGPISHEAQQRVHAHLRAKTFVVPFPGHYAGKPGNQDREPSAYEKYARRTSADNLYYPFASKLDWEVARWAKMRGPGSTAVTELLEINDLVQLLGLSFKNTSELNRIIDADLTSGRPRFIRREIIVAGQAFEVFYRDVIACVRALYGDPEFAGILVFTPERHYADADHTVRVYFDMHTGRWWWDTQAAIEKRRPGATIIPIIISSDKTQLTVFGSKTAYPVYMTIGNLPKDLGIMEATDDAAHARPAHHDRQGRPVPGRFDTVLVSDGTGGPSGVQGYHVGRLRLVFSLSDTARKQLIPDVIDPGPLAYVEWFTQFTQPDPIHGLYKVSRERDRQRSLVASVVEVKNIRRSCHLFPAVNRRDGIIPRDWTSSTVLDSCEDFWVNRYSDMHMYMTFF
ncbi:hypothetical protein L226DRAFT_524416 [Lentinus tigrinus ALCF2SS1-7]|uniref:uncharacterized protein n=1 Tax=Lentinus tigrinus ALCF2SS1-7 TaxID=1328758 RepID=UPI0011663352|nr:hypothetical protein L226DRAFT_524416 [Lentinus tigrinus ALCF2SS1-7]